MKKIAIFFCLISVSFLGCRSVKTVTAMPESVTVDRLVPVYLPADSSLFIALLECDSNKQVLLKQYSELKSKSVASSIDFKNGTLIYKIKVLHDTIFIAAHDSIIYKPVAAKGDQVNYLTGWQWFWLRLGQLAVAVFLMWKLPTLIKYAFKLLK